MTVDKLIEELIATRNKFDVGDVPVDYAFWNDKRERIERYDFDAVTVSPSCKHVHLETVDQTFIKIW